MPMAYRMTAKADRHTTRVHIYVYKYIIYSHTLGCAQRGVEIRKRANSNRKRFYVHLTGFTYITK